MLHFGQENERTAWTDHGPSHKGGGSVPLVQEKEGSNENIEDTFANSSHKEEEIISDTRHIEAACNDNQAEESNNKIYTI